MDDSFIGFIIAMLSWIPFWLALLAGIIVCLIRFRHGPRPALFAAAGFAVILVTHFIMLLTDFFVMHRLVTHAGSISEFRIMYGVRDFVLGVLYGVGFILLLLGAISGRAALANAPPLQPPPPRV